MKKLVFLLFVLQSSQALALDCNPLSPEPNHEEREAAARELFGMSYAELERDVGQNILKYYLPTNDLLSINTDPFPYLKSPIFLIGEAHTNKKMRLAEQALVNSLAQPGDIVLVEGYQAGVSLPQEYFRQNLPTSYLKQGLRVAGWDDIRMIDEGLDVLRETVEMLKKIDPKNASLESMKNSRDPEVQHQRIKLSSYIFIARQKRLEATVRSLFQSEIKAGARVFMIAGQMHVNQLPSDTIKYSTSALLMPRDDFFGAYSATENEEYLQKILAADRQRQIEVCPRLFDPGSSPTGAEVFADYIKMK